MRGDTPIFPLAEVADFVARSHPEFSQKFAKRHVRGDEVFSLQTVCRRHCRLTEAPGTQASIRQKGFTSASPWAYEPLADLTAWADVVVQSESKLLPAQMHCSTLPCWSLQDDSNDSLF